MYRQIYATSSLTATSQNRRREKMGLFENKIEYNYSDIPYWLKNLAKAWEANKKRNNNKKSKYSLITPNDEIGLLKYHLKSHQPEFKKKVGRPKLMTSELKAPKLKRSEQMKQLLKDNDIEVNVCGSLSSYSDWRFLPNGRLQKGSEPPVSVYSFIQSLENT